jgi:YidC/Oxa1 family membrane protein insertase
VYRGDIDTQGGTLSKLTLIKQGDGKQPDLVITLFDHTKDHTYLARTGLFGGDYPNHNDIFTPVPNQVHDLAGNANTMKISLESPVKGGVKVIKNYTYTRGS